MSNVIPSAESSVTPLSVKEFTMNVLNGTALGIVAGLIPGAILGALLKYLGGFVPALATAAQAVGMMQFTVPMLVGTLIGLQFKFKPLQTVLVGAAAFIGSGVVTMSGKGAVIAGIGDLINTMLTASLAVWVLRQLGERLGSLSVLVLPIMAALVGCVGLLLLPAVTLITSSLGQLIMTFTTLQPLLMAVLMSMLFSVLIVSPISSVGMAMAVGLSGLASGAANLGVVAAAALLAVAMWRVNPAGPTLAVLLASPKMMMPTIARKPKLLLPILLNAVVMGITAYFVGLTGTPYSAGFGFVGLVGPLNAFGVFAGDSAARFLRVLLCYVLIPFGSAYLIHMLLTRFKVYTPEDLRVE